MSVCQQIVYLIPVLQLMHRYFNQEFYKNTVFQAKPQGLFDSLHLTRCTHLIIVSAHRLATQPFGVLISHFRFRVKITNNGQDQHPSNHPSDGFMLSLQMSECLPEVPRPTM